MKRRMLKAILIPIAAIVSVLALTFAVFAIGFAGYRFERYSPAVDTDPLDRKAMLALISKSKDTLTDEDYDTLFLQTGLTRIGVDSFLDRADPYGIIEVQTSYFGEYTQWEERFAPLCNSMKLDRKAELAPIRDGDIVIIPSTQFSFWDVGHVALVIDAREGIILESTGAGEQSRLSSLWKHADCASFMIFRPRVDEATLAAITDYAERELVGISYDPTIGILSPKHHDGIPRTNCSHIIWYAFMQYGIDLDPDGGAVVSPRDIAASPHLDLVQIFGISPTGFEWR